VVEAGRERVVVVVGRWERCVVEEVGGWVGEGTAEEM